MKKYRIVASILALCLLFSIIPVFSQAPSNVNELQKERDRVNRQLELTKRQQVQKEKEKKTLSKQIEDLEQRLHSAEKDLEIVENLLSELEGKIVITQREYDRAVAEAVEQKELLNKRVRVMYQNGTIGYLAVLLNSSSFSDFISRMDLLRKIINYDVNILKERKTYRDAVEEKKKQLEIEQEEKEKLKTNIFDKKEEVESVKKERQDTLNAVFKDLKELEKLEDKLLEESARLTKLIVANQSDTDYAGGEMAWPAPGYTRVGPNGKYGMRFHPILKKNRMHTGIDIDVPMGKDIVAANGGKVILAGTNGGYGKCIVIDHGGKISTLYAHNSKLLVKVGDKVKRGQVIAKCGSTGLSTGPHLHFEVRINGKHTDPLPYITKKK
jgi:murein DD-endopeptidase MepM/ murein hydrolase activator NlpD